MQRSSTEENQDSLGTEETMRSDPMAPEFVMGVGSILAYQRACASEVCTKTAIKIKSQSQRRMVHLDIAGDFVAFRSTISIPLIKLTILMSDRVLINCIKVTGRSISKKISNRNPTKIPEIDKRFLRASGASDPGLASKPTSLRHSQVSNLAATAPSKSAFGNRQNSCNKSTEARL